jgi:hypothetical protein
MERWRVPDATALDLIEFSGKIGAWLHRKDRAAPFQGRTPLGLMVTRGKSGIGEVMLRKSLRRNALPRRIEMRRPSASKTLADLEETRRSWHRCSRLIFSLPSNKLIP